MMRLSFKVAVALTAAALAAGCGGSGSGGPAPSTTTVPGSPSVTTTATPGSPPATTTTPGGGGGTTSHSAWSSGPVIVKHNPPVPPVPVVTAIRYAAHPAQGYDRIVFDISGALPGYSVRYVSSVRADPSDRPVAVPGRRHLLIVLNPAQAHRDNGTATVSGTHRISLPMLESYAVVGDFEGHVSIALGLDDVVGYRVGELPGRIYLDLAA
jgi:hypothetical protein